MKPFLAGPAVLLGLAGLLACSHADTTLCQPWGGWQAYKAAFLSPDGRVVADDAGTSVSEGQAYALFFALAANDRAAFDLVLKWTENNLAAGDLTARLPAWRWGKKDDKTWGVLDANAASDADTWMAYALAEAGRLWNVPRYSSLSLLLAQRVLREETAQLPNLGLVLLPGPQGFAVAGNRWRLNPSYLVVPVFRRLASYDNDSGWPRIVESSRRIVAAASPRGFAPDWVEYDGDKGFVPDAKSKAIGGYDAIRVYLWTGVMPEGDPARGEWLKALAPMAALVAARGVPPERVDTATGEPSGDAPAGFSAVMIPFLEAAGQDAAARAQAQRLTARGAGPAKPGYFDQSLTLFATGHRDRRYRFQRDGALTPGWQAVQCPA